MIDIQTLDNIALALPAISLIYIIARGNKRTLTDILLCISLSSLCGLAYTVSAYSQYAATIPEIKIPVLMGGFVFSVFLLIYGSFVIRGMYAVYVKKEVL
jgi:hypothetical protein